MEFEVAVKRVEMQQRTTVEATKWNEKEIIHKVGLAEAKQKLVINLRRKQVAKKSQQSLQERPIAWMKKFLDKI